MLEVGSIHSSSYGDMKVIRYGGSREVSVRFLATGAEYHSLQKGNVVRGNVRDLEVPTVEGVGVVGTTDTSNKKAFKLWKAMLVRCYSDNYHDTRPTYKTAEVCEEWQYYPNFLKWFEDNYVEGYDLDKDCLDLRRKYYSPETCIFIPRKLNSILSYLREGVTHISPRRIKGSEEYNGLWNVKVLGAYLGRFDNKQGALDVAIEYRRLYLRELLDKICLNGELPEKVCKRIEENLTKHGY